MHHADARATAVLAPSVTQSIDATLAAKGYRIDRQTPEFLMAWYVTFGPKERVTTVQTGYGRYRRPGLPPAMSVACVAG